jgi:DNA-binding transcriptional ArsR family regulator
MELIARLFRALANQERLRILRVLTVLGETRVYELTRGLARTQGRVSTHLGVLATSGLVWWRRSGRATYYRLAEDPSYPVTREAIAFVRGAFGGLPEGDIRSVASYDRNESEAASDAALLGFFRAFTHPRRLQILRYLSSSGPATVECLTASLSMSPQACSRHLANLQERNVISSAGRRRGGTYVVSTLADRARRRLVSSIVAQLLATED